MERLVPRCQKVFLELRNSITSNHNVLAAVLYSDGTLKHTGIYDIEHETDRVGAGDAFVGGMIYGLITYPDDDRKALDFALAASALKNTVYGDFNLVTVDGGGKPDEWKYIGTGIEIRRGNIDRQ